MAITIELSPGLQMQAEAYAKARGQSIAELMLASLKQFLLNATAPREAEVEADTTWEKSTQKIMEEYGEVWERLAQL